MSFELLLPFDSDDPEFTRGFEAGRLWERIKNDHTNWDQMIHPSNAEMVIRMCEAEGRTFRSEEVNEEWINIFIS